MSEGHAGCFLAQPFLTDAGPQPRGATQPLHRFRNPILFLDLNIDGATASIFGGSFSFKELFTSYGLEK